MGTALIIILISVAAIVAALIFFTVKLLRFAFISPEKKHMTEPEMLELRKKQFPKYADVFVDACARLEKMSAEKV